MMAVMGLESTGSRMPPDWDTERSRLPDPGKAEAHRPATQKSNRFNGLIHAGDGAPIGMRDALSEAIRSIILPRLVAACHAMDIGLAHAGSTVTESDIATMTAHVLTPDDTVPEAMLTLLGLRGVSRSDVLIDLLQEVAQRLVSMRSEERCSGAETTLALGRLERLAQSKSLPAASAKDSKAISRKVIVANLPGETTALAALILQDHFQYAGWTCAKIAKIDENALADIAQAAPVDVIVVAAQTTPLGADNALLNRLAKSGRPREVLLVSSENPDSYQMPVSSPENGTIVTGDLRKAVQIAEGLRHPSL